MRQLRVTGQTQAWGRPRAGGVFAAMRALSLGKHRPEHASCQFDKDRDGLVLAEPYGIVVQEDLEHQATQG